MHDPLYSAMAKRLHQGAVIAYPTEAVWGLGCDPFNPEAVERLLALKARPVSKGLILVSGDIDDFKLWLDALPEPARMAVLSSWPGPHTWLLPDSDQIPHWIKGDHQQVAMRVSTHPVIQALCRHFGGPIISTSANPIGRPPARTAAQVRNYFGAALDAVVPGKLGGLTQPTTIRDALTGALIRA